jgi:hypothetical protein
MKLYRYQNFIKESKISDDEFNEIKSFIIEIEDRFDLSEASNPRDIKLNEYIFVKSDFFEPYYHNKFDLSFIVNLNDDIYPNSKTLKRFDEIKYYILDDVIPIIERIGYGVKTKILENTFDSWNFVPTGIRMDITASDQII